MPPDRSLFISHADVYLPDRIVRGGSVFIENGLIQRICETGDETPSFTGDRYDAGGRMLLPGFIDVHVHGGGGADAMDAGEDSGAIRRMCRYHAAHGTTALLPTTMTAGRGELLAVLGGIARAVAADADGAWAAGAEVVGIHMEGPFLNAQRCGAQNSAAIRPASRAELDELIAAAAGALKLVTIAPELGEALALVPRLTAAGVTVSIGHSDADAATVRAAVRAGATHVTHLFNGMRPLHHREPGVAGAALLHDELAVELICDGWHVHPDVVRLVYRTKPRDRIVLVTDAVAAAGCPDGAYTLGGAPVVAQGGKVVLRDGGQLAGSCLTLDRALANAVAYTGLPLAEVLPGLTINPARQIGLDRRKGSIEPGKDADLVLMDGDFNVVRTWVRGACVYGS